MYLYIYIYIYPLPNQFSNSFPALSAEAPAMGAATDAIDAVLLDQKRARAATRAAKQAAAERAAERGRPNIHLEAARARAKAKEEKVEKARAKEKARPKDRPRSKRSRSQEREHKRAQRLRKKDEAHKTNLKAQIAEKKARGEAIRKEAAKVSEGTRRILGWAA